MADEESDAGKAMLSLYTTLEERHRKVRKEAGIEDKITCKRGCSLCCYEHVDVYAIEVAPIADAIIAMPLAKQNLLAKRMREYFKVREGTDYLKVLNVGDSEINFEEVPDELELEKIKGAMEKRSLAHRRLSWNMKSPCPFLEDDECTIYEARPYACRSMVSVTRPDYENYRKGVAPIIRFDGQDLAEALVFWAKQNGAENTNDLCLPHGPLAGVVHQLLGDEIFNIEEE